MRQSLDINLFVCKRISLDDHDFLVIFMLKVEEKVGIAVAKNKVRNTKIHAF